VKLVKKCIHSGLGRWNLLALGFGTYKERQYVYCLHFYEIIICVK